MTPGRTAASVPLTVERVDGLESLREDWTRLALKAGHPFATWEWNDLWWRRFGEGRELYLWRCRDEAGQIVAILPMYVAARRPVALARFMGYADIQTPVSDPADAPRVAGALKSTLRVRKGCRLLVAERMPADQGWGSLLGGAEIAGGGQCPVLRFDGRSWDEIMASKKRKFRGNLRRSEEKLRSEHSLGFRLASEPDRLKVDMETLFRLHDSRWGENSSGTFRGDRAAFHLEFARVALSTGWIRLWIAEAAGEPVAAWYGWRYAGSEWFFNGGRDDRFDHLSLGSVMLVNAMREACTDGMDSFEFLAGDEGYKWHFADEDRGLRSAVIGAGATGRIAQQAVAASRALPAGFIQRIRRAVG